MIKNKTRFSRKSLKTFEFELFRESFNRTNLETIELWTSFGGKVKFLILGQ